MDYLLQRNNKKKELQLSYSLPSLWCIDIRDTPKKVVKDSEFAANMYTVHVYHIRKIQIQIQISARKMKTPYSIVIVSICQIHSQFVGKEVASQVR
jgi:hypothetical protein